MKPYQKTAKDLAFDKERAKLRRQIYNLQEALRAAEGRAATKDLVIEGQSETIKNLFRSGFERGMKVGEQEAERKAAAKRKQAEAAIAPERATYQPFCCWGRVHDTDTPLDGHLYLVSLWDWDKYEDFHLVSYGEHDNEAGEAMMKAMHDADDAYKDTPIEEFKELWDKGEYEAPGVYTIPLEKVEIVKIVAMEGTIEKEDETGEPAEGAAAEAPEEG